MDNTAFLISILTALISVAASVGATTMKNRSELKCIRKELEQSYEKSLFEKCVEVYPELYCLLGRYAKIIAYGKATRDDLQRFRDKVDEWNSKYSLFLTPATTDVSWRFRHYLSSLLAEEDIVDIHWPRIARILRTFENALKAEIGIFNIPPAGPALDPEEAYAQIDMAITDLYDQIRSRKE
jgi:hypothetical protein